MILQVFAVFDKKVNAYMGPQMFRTKGEALRAWMDAVRAENGKNFRDHAEDYVYCYLGTYDDHTGRYANVGDAPELGMTAMDCLVVEGDVN